MAKTAVINREQKRRAMVEKFAAKRAELQAIATNMSLSDEERFAARQKLQALPRDSSPVRLRNRSANSPAFVFIADETPLHRKLGVFENRG